MGIEAGFDLSMFVGIGDKLDDLTKVLKREPPKPLYFPLYAAITGPGSVKLGSPPTGRIWNILTLTLLGDVDDHTAVTGTGALYVDVDYQNLSVSQCKIPNLTIPSFTSISAETLWAHSQGDVAVNFAGVSAGVGVTAVITIAEYDEKEKTARHT